MTLFLTPQPSLSVGLVSVSGENKFSPWDDPKVWHVLYADSVTCDPSVPALDDVAFTLEMLNPDSGGKPTSHCGCDETGYHYFHSLNIKIVCIIKITRRLRAIPLSIYLSTAA